MCRVLCVTCRALCPDDFLARMERVAFARPVGVILREKDLGGPDLDALALRVGALCAHFQVPFSVNSAPFTAGRLGAGLHLSLDALRALPKVQRRAFAELGASVHSPGDAREAVSLGATRLVAGHVFNTACKKGLAPRGLGFLRQVCGAAQGVPVFAIGGITPDVMGSVRAAGAAGVCVMSSLMTCDDPVSLIERLREAWRAAPAG